DVDGAARGVDEAELAAGGPVAEVTGEEALEPRGPPGDLAGDDARGDPVAPAQAEAVGAAEHELDVLVLAADQRRAELDVEGDAGALAEARGLVAAVVVEAEVERGQAVDAG